MNRFRFLGILMGLAVLLAACGTPVKQVPLKVTISGDADSGTVLVAPLNRTLKKTESILVDENLKVTLTATPAANYDFAGWSQAAATCGTKSACALTITDATNVTATFTKKDTTPTTATLTVNVEGSGSVAFDVDDTDASGAHDFPVGTVVAMTATPGATSTFIGWTGDTECGTTPACEVTMDANKTVTATFSALASGTIEITFVDGLGTGSVTSDLAGDAGQLNCTYDGATYTTDGACSDTFTGNDPVTLTATPDASSAFVGWGGDGASCGTAAECQVTPGTAQSITARFSHLTAVDGTTTIAAAGTINGKPSPNDGFEVVETLGTGTLVPGAVFTDTKLLPFGYSMRWQAEVVSAVRFETLDIPRGAIVTQATIRFTANEDGTAPTAGDGENVTLTIRGEASIDAAQFTESATATNGITSRTLLDPAVAWSPAPWAVGDLPQTDDLAAIVQAVVNQAGWAGGNPIVFTFWPDPDDADPTVGFRTATDTVQADTGVPDAAPVLSFQYK